MTLKEMTDYLAWLMDWEGYSPDTEVAWHNGTIFLDGFTVDGESVSEVTEKGLDSTR